MKIAKIYALNNGINTIAFFKKVFLEGASAVQCDIRRTLDGQFIAIRDRSLSRLCGMDWVVSGTSWGHIHNLPVRGGEPIAHLDDVLNFMIMRPRVEFFFNLAVHTAQDAADFAHQISKAGIQNRAFVTVPFSLASFAAAAKKSVKNIGAAFYSSLPLDLLGKAKRGGFERICIMPNGFLGSEIILRFASKIGVLTEQIKNAAQNNIEVSVGIVNGPNTLHRALAMGAQAFWTDNVPLSEALLK